MSERRKRAPSGVVTNHPICLRLMSEERATIEEEARKRGMTVSAMTREVVLAGLPNISTANIRDSA